MAVTVTAFNQLAKDLANGAHDLDTHQLKAALSNAAPTATDTDLVDITEISAVNGYSSGGFSLGGVTGSNPTVTKFKLDANDLQITASGGTMSTFRYIVLYNSTASNKLLLWYDLGTTISLSDGSSYTLEFDATNGILTMDVV